MARVGVGDQRKAGAVRKRKRKPKPKPKDDGGIGLTNDVALNVAARTD